MQKKVTIIGGGIIGLSTAYFLQKEGCEVTIVDRSNMNSGASYSNAGYVCPSHFIPLAVPGVVRSGLRWMLDASSPLYIKPNLNRDFLKWAWAFNKSANSRPCSKKCHSPSRFYNIQSRVISNYKKRGTVFISV